MKCLIKIKRSLMVLFLPLLSLLLNFGFFGSSVSAIDFLPSGYNNIYALQNPGSVRWFSGGYNGSYLACGSFVDWLPQAQNGLYISISNGGGCYPTSANDFTLHAGDLIHVQITGAKGFISSYNIGYFEGASGTFLGLTNHSLGEDSIVDLYFIANNVPSYNTRFEFMIHTGTISQPNIIKMTAFNVWSLPGEVNYSSSLTNIQNELKECGGNSACEQNYLKRWVFEIYGVTNNISSTVTNISNGITNINTSLADLNDNQLATIDAIESQSQQQSDQYEQEKQEEAEREESIQGNADDASSTFSFQIQNPFSAMFTDVNCPARIPQLAQWLHSPTSTYNCWFPHSVRDVLTPVISILATMILFGFVIKWLGGFNVEFVENKGEKK